MISLVGYTGFVGSNLSKSFAFDGLYNSKNIQVAFGTAPDILYYAGVPAQKFMANKFPKEDIAIIENAAENIRKINPKKLVLISTVDVYKDPCDRDENSVMDKDGLLPYGLNRLQLEEEIQKHVKDFLIVRLPGLYGENLKKNFIYDFLSFIPATLTKQKLEELAGATPQIFDYYDNQNNGFYTIKQGIDRRKLRQVFESNGFSALKFTDSRSEFQFYNLEYLYKDIQIAIKNDIKLLNIATQPTSAQEIYAALTGESFDNIKDALPPRYNFKTIHHKAFSGENGYIQKKEFVLADIKKYVDKNKGNF